jgi:hypothetical protein
MANRIGGGRKSGERRERRAEGRAAPSAAGRNKEVRSQEHSDHRAASSARKQ